MCLKKEVIARISDNEMSHLKGGQSDNACTTPYCPKSAASCQVCPTPTPNTCGTAWTCNG